MDAPCIIVLSTSKKPAAAGSGGIASAASSSATAYPADIVEPSARRDGKTRRDIRAKAASDRENHSPADGCQRPPILQPRVQPGQPVMAGSVRVERLAGLLHRFAELIEPGQRVDRRRGPVVAQLPQPLAQFGQEVVNDGEGPGVLVPLGPADDELD